jgi:signal transduction histidine kinase
MTPQIPCPNCVQMVDPQARYCEHCGVDLALAAVAAEQVVAERQELPQGVPLAPEVLVPRIGEYMLDQGILSEEDLQKGLDYQTAKAAEGEPMLVGQALLELGLVDRKTLEGVITHQILQLQNALNDANRRLERRVQERTLDLQRALDRLAELNQLKSNFIANISHELRTPLTHIKGYLDLLLDEELGPLNSQQNSALQVLRRAENRLEHLIEDLIQFSLAARGELSLSLNRTNLGKLIEVEVERSQSKAKLNQVALEARVDDPLPVVEADADKMAWVLSQLVDNAIKFTPKEGRVEITAGLNGRRVQVVVNDTGIGIPPERMDEIFEPFHQLDGSATRRYGGTGLGLAMVRRIIEAHGSQVNINSVVGQGTRFEFTLRACLELSEEESGG